MFWNIQRCNWRVSAFTPAIPLTLTEVHQRGENNLPSPFLTWMKSLSLASVNACSCVLPSTMIATNTRDEFRDCGSSRSLQIYRLELLFSSCSKQWALREVPFVFCRCHVFESVWMCRKVHFRAADIPSPCLCSQRCFLSTSLSLLSGRKTHPWTIAFWEKYFLLDSNALLRNEIRILLLKLVLTSVSNPSQLRPALENFCQNFLEEKEISAGFDLEFKLLQTPTENNIFLRWLISKSVCKICGCNTTKLYMSIYVKVYLIQSYMRDYTSKDEIYTNCAETGNKKKWKMQLLTGQKFPSTDAW